MKSKVFIRVDGNSQIGLGHLIRCIALAEMLKEDFAITFVSKEIPKDIKNTILNKGFGCKEIESESEFFTIINENDIVVLDSYEFDTQYQSDLKKKNIQLVCIDDLHDKYFEADLIINHAPGISPQDYKAKLSTQFALGTEYALLRPEFIDAAKKERAVNPIKNLLICFGGSDSNNFTKRTLQTALSFDLFKKIIVVTGSGYMHIDTLQEIVESDSRIEHYNSIDAKKMSEMMSEADLAIVPSSGILLEALASGCKIISGMTADNQKYVYLNYLNSGYFTDAKDFSKEALSNAIASAINNERTNDKKIDGKSRDRLLKLLRQLVLKGNLTLKKASLSDLDTTYKWAADPAVRAYSFTQNKISIQEHTDWFTKKVKDKNCLYLIAEAEGNKVGSIRFDIKNNEAIISYLISPKFHGKGFGQIILTNGLEYLQNEIANKFNKVKKVIGFVMEENIPSVKAFERLGFNKIKEADRIKYEKVII